MITSNFDGEASFAMQVGFAEKLQCTTVNNNYGTAGGDPENIRSLPVSFLEHEAKASAMEEVGRLAEAEAEYRALAQRRSRLLGPGDCETLQTRHNVAAILFEQGRYLDAEIELREISIIQHRTLGGRSPEILGTRHQIARALHCQGLYYESAAEYWQVAMGRITRLGIGHPDAFESHRNAITLWEEAGYLSRAEAECEILLTWQRSLLGESHRYALWVLERQGLLLYRKNKLDEAEKKLSRLTELLKEKHYGTPRLMDNLHFLLEVLKEKQSWSDFIIRAHELLLIQQEYLTEGNERRERTVSLINEARTTVGNLLKSRPYPQLPIDHGSDVVRARVGAGVDCDLR